MSAPAPAPRAQGKRAPGPSNWRMFHLFSDFARDSIATLHAMRERYGDVVRWPMPHDTVHVVYHPDGVKHLLQDNYRNYIKGPAYLAMKPFIGEGLLLAEGDNWLRLRRLTQPPFHRHNLSRFVDTMVHFASTTFDRWEEVNRQGGTLDAEKEMMELTLVIVGATLLSAHLSDSASHIGHSVSDMLEVIERRVNSVLPVPLAIPTPNNRRFLRAKKTLDAVVAEVLERKHRLGPEKENDMLSMLMQVRDQDTGEGMSDSLLHDSVMTMIIAGHETSANTLAWAWYRLSRHPDVEQRVFEELEQVLGGRPPTLEDMPKLKYLQRVLEEILRLYPAAWMLARRALEEDVISGFHIPKGSLIYFSPYMVHRHPDFWPDPERFDPDRFLPENQEGRTRFSYFPFGGGPRQCIGYQFAMMEIMLILAVGLQRFRPRLAEDHQVGIRLVITMRPLNGVKLRLEPRVRAQAA
ncbi:cytochrome P450 [Melittangium boletus]|uniref:cytochrome P450 n=1 Tax=Melittangium boletus TaxID=83453 RepID=UPI003DA33B44